MARGTANTSYEGFAGLCAGLVGLLGFLYAVSFIVLLLAGVAPQSGRLLSSHFLMMGGLLTSPVLVALYHRLRDTDAAFALLGLLLGVLGAAGVAIHGGYDLANAIHTPAAVPSDLPSQVDPRGLLAFLVSGLGLLVIAWLMARGRGFPRGLAYLGYLSALLLVILYLGRLLVLDPKNPEILVPSLLNGFLINPLWYGWVGVTLWRGKQL